MFLATTLPTAKMIESAEDITAALRAPRAITDTTVGHRYWSTLGRMDSHSVSLNGRLPSYDVAFQSKIRNTGRYSSGVAKFHNLHLCMFVRKSFFDFCYHNKICTLKRSCLTHKPCATVSFLKYALVSMRNVRNCVVRMLVLFTCLTSCRSRQSNQSRWYKQNH